MSESNQERARNLMRELALPEDQARVDLIADGIAVWRKSWERETRERCAQIARDEIASSTGPTGGWLDSPKAILAVLVDRMKG